ncbi:MAG TPA: hypothetical protein VH143_09650 [Kofleriaceae bacterium]|jgi:hypothetical protein|nr:hypothetical protein [Kofleriaceae bacterium]
MLASRAPVVAELLIAGIAMALVALSPPRPAPAHAPAHRELLRVVHVELGSPPAKLDCSGPLPPNLGAMFRDHEFDAVANAVGACRDTQELLRQLARSYAVATSVHARLEDRFHATQEAIKLDIAFGGAHVDELRGMIGELARDDARGDRESLRHRARIEAQLSGELSPAAKNAAQ